MTEPLVVEFNVAVPPEHAFQVWTEKISLWWPASHTVGGDNTSSILFESHVGGRIFERHPDGTEHDWGWVTEWSPPHRVAYKWHLFFDADEATDVEVSFTPAGTGTVVGLRQTGWERLGPAAEVRRGRTQGAWAEITGFFAAAVVER